MPAAPDDPAHAELSARIDALLPQTQCQRCGYPDCRSYAEAIASAAAPINRCPPGAQEGIARLAQLLHSPELPLDPACGAPGPMRLAVIDEDWCIGCTLCLKVCPTDAIVGSHKRMHSVLEAYCSGCDLCLPVCPVDCISMENVSGTRTGWSAWSEPLAQRARQRYQARQQRLQRSARIHEQRLLAKAEAKLANLGAHSKHTDPELLARKQALVEAAVARARARLSAPPCAPVADASGLQPQ